MEVTGTGRPRPRPRISIVIPSLDQGRFLGHAIGSVLDQGYPDLELFVVDGGSTDESRQVIEAHQASLTWWTSEPDRGQSDAIARGMARATGDVVNWLNADDVLLPGALHAVADAFRDLPRAEAVLVGGAVVLDEQGRGGPATRPTPATDPLLPHGPPLEGGIQASWFLTKGAWDAVGGVDPDLHFAMDIDLYLRCAEAGVDFVAVDAVVAGYRRHPATKTAAAWRASISEKRDLLRAHAARLDPADRARHRRRLRQYVASLHANAVQPGMTAPQRARRVAGALAADPGLVGHPDRLKRLAVLLARGARAGS